MSETDNNGFREIKDNPISKVGVFPYLGKDIPGAPDPTAIYYVYRPAEELAHPDCINSFKLLPWIEEHTTLGTALPGGIPVEQRPISGVIGEDVYFRDGYLRGNLKLFSSLLAAKIDSDEKRELSASYVFRLDDTPGEFEGRPYQYIQRNIRGNHLASVKEGRSGPDVCVGDSMDVFIITFDQSELTTMAEENEPGEGEGGGEGTKVSEMTLSEAIALLNKLAPQVQKLTEAMEAMNAQKPAEPSPEPAAIVGDKDEDANKTIQAMDAQIKQLQKQVAAMANDSGKNVKDVLASIANRDALAKRLSAHVGTFEYSEKTIQEVAKYGVEKLGIACDSGSELAYLNGYLDARQSKPAAIANDSAAVKTAEATLDSYINGGTK